MKSVIKRLLLFLLIFFSIRYTCCICSKIYNVEKGINSNNIYLFSNAIIFEYYGAIIVKPDVKTDSVFTYEKHGLKYELDDELKKRIHPSYRQVKHTDSIVEMFCNYNISGIDGLHSKTDSTELDVYITGRLVMHLKKSNGEIKRTYKFQLSPHFFAI